MSFVSSLGRVQESILIKNRMLLCNTLLHFFSMVRPRFFHKEQVLASFNYILFCSSGFCNTNSHQRNDQYYNETGCKSPTAFVIHARFKSFSKKDVPWCFTNCISNIVSNRWQQSPCLFVFGYNIIIFHNSAGVMFLGAGFSLRREKSTVSR